MERCLRRLAALREANGSESYAGFAAIGRRTGLDRATVRRAVRALARRGFAEYQRGLYTYEGRFAGAGYRITDAGYWAAHHA